MNNQRQTKREREMLLLSHHRLVRYDSLSRNGNIFHPIFVRFWIPSSIPEFSLCLHRNTWRDAPKSTDQLPPSTGVYIYRKAITKFVMSPLCMSSKDRTLSSFSRCVCVCCIIPFLAGNSSSWSLRSSSEVTCDILFGFLFLFSLFFCSKFDWRAG